MSIFNFRKKQPPTDESIRLLTDAIIAAIRPPHVSNRYDALKTDPLRTKPEIRYDLSQTEQMFTAEKRVIAYAMADNLYDNDDVGSTLETCIRTTIGTSGGTPLFIGPDGPAAQERFDAWKKSAGFTENEHYSDMLSLILRLVKLHGDCLILMDEDLTGSKLRVWDADQICSIGATDFLAWCEANGGYDIINEQKTYWRQIEGVVVNAYGQVKGYFATSLRNRYAVTINDAVFLPATLARRIAYHRKHTQYRGEPLFLPNSQLTEDTRSLLKSEVQAARNAAELSFILKRGSGPENKPLSALLDGMTSEQATEGLSISADDLDTLKEASKSVTDFTAFEGHSSIGEIPHDADVIKLSSDRPSAAVQSWIDNLADSNGKRMGVMSLFSRGRADNSYSSGQIEISISWKQFEEDHKLLERQVVDYICGVLCPGCPYIVEWPKPFEIDPHKAEATLDARLRGGRTTLQEILGPRYQEKLQQLSEEKKLLEKLGLTNLSFFQTASGAAVADQEPTQEESRP